MKSSTRMQPTNKTWAFMALFGAVLLLSAFMIEHSTSALLGEAAGAMAGESESQQTTPTRASETEQVENAPTSSMPVEEPVRLPRYPLVAGDSPQDAIWIYEGLNGPFDDTLATDDPNDCVYKCFHNGPNRGTNTMWFAFQVASPNTTATIRTCATTDAGDTIVGIHQSFDPDEQCPWWYELACGEDECGYNGFMSEACAENLTDQETYLVQVASFAPEYAGEFWIELILDTECAEPVVGACCNPEDASCSLADWETCRQLDGIHSGDGTDCAEVTCTGACCSPDGSCEDTPQAGCTENFQGIGTTCATVDCPLAPANDDCLTAEPLGPIPVSVTANNASARLDDTPDCEIPPPYRGMWYVVQGTGNTMIATTCNSITDIDTMLHVWCGDCEYLLDRFCLGGNDDECQYARYFTGLRSTVSWCSMEGAEYYILVGGYDNETGTFRLNVYDDGETCPDPINCNAEGACCIDGTCAVMSPGLCALGGGTYVADDVACDPDPCGGNDDCLHAQDVGPLPATAVANNTLASNDDAGVCGTIPPYQGVWYEVTGSGNVITAATCNETTALDTVIQVWCGDCEYPTCITASDDDCPDADRFSSTLSWCSIPGRTYHLLVGGFDGEVGTLALDITDGGVPCTNWIECPVKGACCIEGACSPLSPGDCATAGGIFAGAGTTCDPDPCQHGACCLADGICQDLPEAECAGTYRGDGTTCTSTPCPGPGNDCADPMVITLGLDDLPFTHVASTCARGDSLLAYPSSSGDGEDMVFQLEITEEMTVDFTITSDELWLFTALGGDCPPPPPSFPSTSEDDALGPVGIAIMDDVTLLPGTYYLTVDSYLPTDCVEPFTLSVTASPHGACCYEDGTCLVTDWSYCYATPPWGFYHGDGTDCDPNPCGLGACCAGTTCSLTVEDDCAASGGVYYSYITTCDPNPCEPINDNCEDAILMTDESMIFDTTSASTDGLAHEECDIDGQTYNDIWYNYEATCSGTLLVSTCDDADFDTELVVYSGWDCDHVLLDCNDDSTLCGDDTSLVTVPATVGERFTIRVGGFRGESRGVGTLTVACLDEGACCHDFSGFGCSFMDEALCLDIGGDYGGEGSACVAEDCNANEVIDVCDITAGSSQDCNLNGVPDDCDITGGHDCCVFDHGPSCSHPLIRDCVCAVDPYCCDVEWDRLCVFEVTSEGCADCDANNDCNSTGVLDECETIITGDFDGNGLIELGDYAGFHACLSLPCGELQCDPPVYEDFCCYLADFDADGDADLQDFTSLQEEMGNR